jgi:hypothetical protein
MARTRAPARNRTIQKSLGLLLLVNIVPLGVLGYLAVQYARGEIQIEEDQIPEGLTQTLIWVGVAILALFLIASISLPAAHNGVKSLEMACRRGKAVLAGREPGSRILALLALPFQGLFLSIAWVIRLVLILLSFALIVVVGLFLARLKWPDLGQEWIDAVAKWGG